GRRVAVKVLPKSLLIDDHQLKRFEHEARTAGALHHTNIVPVFGVGDDQGFHYYVMQRIEGRGLDRVLSEGTKLTVHQVAKFGYQAASALAYAHQHNVLHRDIKPANLIVNDDDQLWVTDFGVSKAIESEAVTRTGDVVGTLRYMAPEQIVGVTDVRSDIYSLGVTLYELLAGRAAMDDASVRKALVERRPVPLPPPLRQLNPSVPRDLETILQTAMSVDMKQRYRSAQQLAQDLQACLNGEPISVRRMLLWEQAARWGKRNPAVAALSALSLALLVGVAVLSTVGYINVQNALGQAETARNNAVATAAVASDTLDKVFARFSESPREASNSWSQFSSSPATLSSEVAELLEDLILDYGDLISRSESDPELQRSAANARYAMGDIYFRLGNYQQSIEAFTLCLHSASAPSQSVSAPSRYDQEDGLVKARIHNRIGHAYRILGEQGKAEEEHALALKLLTRDDSAPDPLPAEVRFEIARSHYLHAMRLRPGMGPTAMPPLFTVLSIGTGAGPPRPGMGGRDRRAERRNELPGPLDRLRLSSPATSSLRPSAVDEAHLHAAIRILRQLRLENPGHFGYAVALAVSLRQLAGDSIANVTDETDAMNREAIELLRQLHQAEPANVMVRGELAVALSEVSVFEDDVSLPKMDRTIERLREAIEHFQALSLANPNVPAYTNRLAHAHFRLGIMLERFANAGPLEPREVLLEAGTAFNAASQSYRTLVHHNADSPGYRAWLALFLQHQGNNAIGTHQDELAERVLKESIYHWNTLIETHPQEQVSWQALPHTFQMLALAQHRRGKDDEADESKWQADISRMFRDLQP
ncbi:MAG: serine/threonine-protein kinase, partial [Pirellulales bacterium]|nr:serine/threonine-protein kinase [Pirellulales bacterium]